MYKSLALLGKVCTEAVGIKDTSETVSEQFDENSDTKGHLKKDFWGCWISLKLAFSLFAPVMVMSELVELVVCWIHYWSYGRIIFLGGFAGQGVIKKNPTVWLDGGPTSISLNYEFDKLIVHTQSICWCMSWNSNLIPLLPLFLDCGCLWQQGQMFLSLLIAKSSL